MTAKIEETRAVIEIGELPKVWGQEFRLNQLFQNLVSNAIKFRGEREPRVEVKATVENGHHVFCVADNGIGISPSYHDQIFVMFKRLHSRDKYEGTGVGLALCKKIVEGYGGKIWVESRPGEGSRFYFTLPNRADSKHLVA